MPAHPHQGVTMLIVILSVLVITFTLMVLSWVIQQECDICELIEEEKDV